MSESSERFLPIACVRYLIYNTRMAFSSVHTSANQSPSPSANQPTNRPTNQPTNQPTDQPAKQPTNQPTTENHMPYLRGWSHRLFGLFDNITGFKLALRLAVIFTLDGSVLFSQSQPVVWCIKYHKMGKYCRFMFPIAQHDKYLVLCYCTKGIFLSPD